ncbi:MAG: ATP-dependent protease ATPase subunit HslU, partial [Candidatus Mcinerneyibacterium aminivorans]
MVNNKTPKQTVEHLNQYIIGQNKAKKSIAIALRNRWRRRQLDEELREEVLPKNILMIGPTGVGKTEIARRLANMADAPFLKVEASKFTEVGYMGRNVESMIRDLVRTAVNNLKENRIKELRPEVEEIAEERILDLLLPNTSEDELEDHEEFDKGDETEEGIDRKDQQIKKSKREKFKNTREKFRKMFREGKLDDKIVEYKVKKSASPQIGVLSNANFEQMGIDIQDMLSNMMPTKKKRTKMKVKDAYEKIINEETEKKIDMDAIGQEARNHAENSGIIFIDEIDKIAGREAKGKGPDVSREGVQRDMLPIVEGSTVYTKYGFVKTDHILFVAAGAFNVSKPNDLIPELQGRFPIRVELNSLSQHDFSRILKEPRNSLIRQYQHLLRTEDVELVFTDEAIDKI